MTVLEQARAIREAMDKMSTDVSDAVASVTAVAFPKLTENGSLIRVGTRINWNNVIKKATVDLWDTAENNPENAPTLWEDLTYRDGYRIIPDVITVTAAFSQGECGWWEDTLYRSKVNGNVYTPAVYPDNWDQV